MTDVPPLGSDEALANDWRAAVAVGRFGIAKQSYLMAGEGDEDVRYALATLAEVEALVREKSWVRARKRLTELDVRPPVVLWDALETDLDVIRRAGEALDRREPESALKELDALTSTAFPAEAETQRGTAKIFDGLLDEARACFNRALAIDPNHYRALTNLGNVDLEQGNVDEAIECYQKALKLNEEFANAHHNLGVAYRRKGNVTKSVQSLRKAQRSMQRHDTAEARSRLGEMGSKNGMKMVRWALYAVVAGVLYWLLKSRGFI